ncbi:MAG: HPr family phosphocarrier protein [Elusimicrobia bacterium]|nr:HPr family phosphocarrier protein [Elusimicrobiota bacterium]
MIEKLFTVKNRLGLHARPASLFVQTASRHRCKVTVVKATGGEEVVVNGKSVMGLMMLAAACGEDVKVVLEGPDEKEALKRLEDLFTRKFDEE